MNKPNVVSFFRKSIESNSSGQGSTTPPSGPSHCNLPKLELAQDMGFIAAKAEATHKGDIQESLCKREIDEHHDSIASAYLKKLSEMPKGMEQAKNKELAHVRSDLTDVNKELSKLTKRIEKEVASVIPRTPAEVVKLVITGSAAAALALWSIYSTHAFLSMNGIFSGLVAWGVAIGPIMFSFAMKEAITILEGDHHRRMLRLSYIGVTGVSSIVWITTFGHEAGMQITSFTNLNAVVAPSAENSWLFTTRGVAQMLIELFGGAILFHASFELWEKKGECHDTHKVVLESPQYIAAEKERNSLRAREHELETHLGQIAKWFESHTPFKDQYKTRAQGLYTHVLNGLKGV